MRDIIKISVGIYVICFALLTTRAYGQEKSYPEIGRLMPSFALKADQKDIKGKLSSNELKGKYYILDFWSTGCGACVASFPKTDTLQTKYDKDLQIVLVGLEEKHRDVRKFFDIYRKRYALKITTFLDSSSFNRFVPASVPHLIWVNGDGIVKAITTTTDLTDDNIARFIKDKDFKFEDYSYSARRKAKLEFKRGKPLLIEGNGGDDTSYAFRTILLPWKIDMGSPHLPEPRPNKVNGRAQYQIIGAPVEVLYAMAYFGTTSIKRHFPNAYPVPQFSEKAKQLLQRRFDPSQRFSYSIEMPYDIATTKLLMRKMQDDLSAFFGLAASIVQKKMPVYSLTVVDWNKFDKIRSSTGRQLSTWFAENKIQHFINTPISQFIEILPSKLNLQDYIYIYNETGYTSNMSFDLDAKIYDLDSIRKGLRKVGLDLVPAKKEMQVLDITEGHL